MAEHHKVGDLVYDPDIYDGLNKQDEDLKFYLEWIKEKENQKILELCCGTGRLTIPISIAGYNISGVDNNIAMLNMAKHKAKMNGITIEFFEADIRYLSLKTKYDVIFIPFNSIHHLYRNEDLFLAFECVFKHLNDEGIFLFDCYNPDIEYIVNNEGKTTLMRDYTTEKGRRIVINQNMQYDKKTQINQIKWQYVIDGKFEPEQSLDMRMYYPQELDEYVRINGFTIFKKYGDFNSSDFMSNSVHQIFVCKKSKN